MNQTIFCREQLLWADSACLFLHDSQVYWKCVLWLYENHRIGYPLVCSLARRDPWRAWPLSQDCTFSFSSFWCFCSYPRYFESFLLPNLFLLPHQQLLCAISRVCALCLPYVVFRYYCWSKLEKEIFSFSSKLVDAWSYSGIPVTLYQYSSPFSGRLSGTNQPLRVLCREVCISAFVQGYSFWPWLREAAASRATSFCVTPQRKSCLVT